MSRLVVDASVAVKWLLSQRQEEAHTDQALLLLDAVRNGRVDLIQPPHWLAEVGAVLARLEPELAGEAVQLLHAMEFAVRDDAAIYTRGIELAVRLNQHLFDTLYHAVALSEPGTMLVTADMRYFRKAKPLGAIVALTKLPEMLASQD